MGGEEVVRAVLTTCFPFLRLDTVPLVAVVVFATCLLILWVFLHLRQEARELPTTK